MLYTCSCSGGHICYSLSAWTPLVCLQLHGDCDGISLADSERPARYYQESVFILNQLSVVWRSERGYLGLGFTGDGGGPPLPSFTSSLCASSLRRSRVLIHDNTHMQTHLHQAGIFSHPLARHTAPRTHTSAHTHTVASLESQSPTTSSLPHFGFFSTQAALSYSCTAHFCFLSVRTLSTVFWQPQSLAPHTHHSFPDATSTLCRGKGA